MAITRPAAPPPTPRMLPTGSTLLDLQNGGGWALGRMVNIVGDSSSGKTLLAIEACANLARLYGVENIRYCETESAFDDAYAARLGMPQGISRASDVRTVEDFYNDLNRFLNSVRGPAALYCLDSVDALSSAEESTRKVDDKATYGVQKAKVLHELFRRQCVDIGKKNCCLLMISQVKDNIGNIFVPKTRSGGRALDFFASQIVWLHEVGKEKRMASGVERVVGITVRSMNKKNKVGEPFRAVDFLLVFNYGVDDELSMIEWLRKNHAADDLSIPLAEYPRAVRRARADNNLELLSRYAGDLRAATRAHWLAIENALAPPLRKYSLGLVG